MSKIYEVYVYALEDNRGFLAESPDCCIKTNIPEIMGTPVEFYDNTREGAINQVLAHFKAKGLHGRLRVIGAR